MNLEFVAEILREEHSKRFGEEEPYPEYLAIVEARDSVLDRFRKEFEDVGSLAKSSFVEFLEFKHNCHWTNLKRPSSKAADDMPKLRRAFEHLFDESIPISKRMDNLDGGGTHSIRGLAKAILTAVLTVRFPDKYGVWNGKSESAMKSLQIWPDFKRGTSLGAKYERLNKICIELSSLIGIDLWCLDGLWHIINSQASPLVDIAFEEDEKEQRKYFEGKAVKSSGIRYERNPAARQACLDANGYDCSVCSFNFLNAYGIIGLDYIHVHHVRDLALLGDDYEIDPKKDLVPVCPNCHAMLHKGAKPARKIEELKAMLRKFMPKQSQPS